MFEADMKCTDWLRWFVRDDRDGDAGSVFTLANGWRGATDGKLAVVTSEPGSGGKSPRVAKYIEAWLSEPVEVKRQLPYAEAKALFGECQHPEVETCDECHGKKMRPHYCGCDLCEADEEECLACDSTGNEIEKPDERPVLVFGSPVDANLAAYIFAHAPAAETCGFAWHGSNLRITTERWTAFVAKMDDSLAGPEVMEEKR